jgi:DNA-binding NtrC family response regulator
MHTKESDTRLDGLRKLIESYEKDLITDALKITFGNQARAAKLLHTSRRIINYKVHKYDIHLTDFRLTRLKTKKNMKNSIPDDVA